MRVDDLLNELECYLRTSTWRSLPTRSNEMLDRIFEIVVKMDCSRLNFKDRKQIEGILLRCWNQENGEHLDLIREFTSKWLADITASEAIEAAND